MMMREAMSFRSATKVSERQRYATMRPTPIEQRHQQPQPHHRHQ
jgi:hypothetical protein